MSLIVVALVVAENAQNSLLSDCEEHHYLQCCTARTLMVLALVANWLTKNSDASL